MEPVVDPVYRALDGAAAWLPLEFCDSLTPEWFWKDAEYQVHASAEAISGWRTRARAAQANLLLNIGPDTRGLIPEYHRGFLRSAERMAGQR